MFKDTIDIIEYLLYPLLNRTEIFDAAIDRGCGSGMQIEKWILIEMLAKLKKLTEPNTNSKSSILSEVEGEHKYSNKEAARYEHCDLWWIKDNQEHWLEVKTIVFRADKQLGKYDNISNDIKKAARISPSAVFHHLSFLFPVKPDDIDVITDDIDAFLGLTPEKVFSYKIWPDRYLLVLLYSIKGE